MEQVLVRSLRATDRIRERFGDFDLVEYRLDHPFPPAPARSIPRDVQLSVAFTFARQCTRDLSVFGGHIVTTLEPSPDEKSAIYDWIMNHRFFVMIPPDLSEPRDHRVFSRRWRNPDDDRIANIVTRTHRYPTALITGNAERTAEALQMTARKKQMCSFAGMLDSGLRTAEELAAARERIAESKALEFLAIDVDAYSLLESYVEQSECDEEWDEEWNEEWDG
jgi:hypothetical protein